MPAFDPAVIQKLVNDGEIAAVTLDTSIFDQFQCNLSNKSLTAIEQFNGTNIEVLLSSITLHEVRSHIIEKVKSATEKALAGIEQYVRVIRDGRDSAEMAQQLNLITDYYGYADLQVGAFVSSIGAIEVPVEPGVSVAELVRRYFAESPPFSAKDSKKNEFPDAIALLSLEGWAEAHLGYVLAVSKDGDWKKFGTQSARIICVDDLPTALNFFHTESSVFAARLDARIRAKTAPVLSLAISEIIQRYINDFEADASSDYMLEEEPEYSQLLSWNILEGSSVDVLTSDEENITISVEVEVEAEFGGHFSFSLFDSIDRDYVSIGSTSKSVKEIFCVPIVVTLPKKEDDNPIPSVVEVQGGRLIVDFDYIEPDWGHDE